MGQVLPSTVTCRSSITSKRAAWVLAGARLISSMSIILANTGPFLNSNSLVFILYTEVPKISEGIRSGVNCMREKPDERLLASNLDISVLAIPGTPSNSTWPSARAATRRRSTVFFCPTITFPMVSRMVWIPCESGSRFTRF